MGPTALRAALITMAQLVSYEEMKGRALRLGLENDVRLHLGCAMVSGALACLVTQPVDCVKTRALAESRWTLRDIGQNRLLGGIINMRKGYGMSYQGLGA